MRDDDIQDLFAFFSPVRIRRMFGGRGIYVDGLIVAIELRGELLLKADDVTAPVFEDAGARRWTYDKAGKTVLMPYWSTPVEAMEDPAAFARWAKLAYEAAQRAKS